MKHGDTFIRKDRDKHLWIVLSDPLLDPDKVLLVNVTTINGTKETACVLDVGDHPWIAYTSCVHYLKSEVTSHDLLCAAKDGGAFLLQEPLAPSVLRRVLDGAAESIYLSLDRADILINQGLIDC
ncbi:MAG: hypothetical protein K2X38_09325 [Gemmataceae bacterium]|nr:hypothetical protein [Gemmataceae bacterium]